MNDKAHLQEIIDWFIMLMIGYGFGTGAVWAVTKHLMLAFAVGFAGALGAAVAKIIWHTIFPKKHKPKEKQ